MPHQCLASESWPRTNLCTVQSFWSRWLQMHKSQDVCLPKPFVYFFVRKRVEREGGKMSDSCFSSPFLIYFINSNIFSLTRVIKKYLCLKNHKANTPRSNHFLNKKKEGKSLELI